MAKLLLTERPTDRRFGPGNAFRIHPDGSREETSYFPLLGETTLIGRSEQARLDVWLTYHPVNNLHAAIRRRSEGDYVEDFATRNGTTVNGVALGSESRKLEDGDKIGITGYLFVYRTSK